MLVSGALSVPPKGRRLRRLPSVVAGRREFPVRVVHYLEKASVSVERGQKNSKKVFVFHAFFSVKSKISIFGDAKIIVKHVGLFRQRRESVVKYVGLYRR